MAKLIIKFINSVGEVINNDTDVNQRLKVVFLPDYNVSFGQKVYPAADLSEQISTAGTEASGTGNMKFAMNGAITIGTLDGANVEIREAVGAENFFLFGLTADQVRATQAAGYHPWDIYQSNPSLREVIDSVSSGQFSRGDRELFRPLMDSLLQHDPYLLFADYQSYVDCQDQVAKAYADQERWSRMSILNASRMGRFSSDRSITEYCEDIWNVAVKSIAAAASDDSTLQEAQSPNLLPCKVGSDVSGDGDHEALPLVRLDHAHDPKDERQQSDQAEQHYSEAKAGEVAVSSKRAESSERPAKAEHDCHHFVNDIQSAEGYDGLRGMEPHVRPFVDQVEDDAGEPSEHIAQGGGSVFGKA